ncbi:MAG: peptidoglycan-binding protein [Actinobacteria bacterium]|nr:peptidoglycan-binding protein [Actinomycetota bacterium]
MERTLNRWMTVLFALLAPLLVVASPSSGTVSAIEPVDEIVAYVVEGTGNGHGRGLSQWGAYGWAVEQGKDWQWILDHYYGGTYLGDIDSNQRIQVRLTDFDGASWMGVISETATATWSTSSTAGGSYGALKIVETSANMFQIYGRASSNCPGGEFLTVPDGSYSITPDLTPVPEVTQIQEFLKWQGLYSLAIDGQFGPKTRDGLVAFQIRNDLARQDGTWGTAEYQLARALIALAPDTANWTLVDTVNGPVAVQTSLDESTSSPGDVLGLCSGSGSVTHYRGSLEIRDTSSGNRVVNDVLVENYLRGVVPREVSASWGDRGGGAGMNALRAQAVAARSYGVQQARYDYAGTCDTSSCQVYGGAATRATASASVTALERPQTDTAISETAGKVRRWQAINARNMPANDIVSTEFSASNGPQTAGGYFPSVPDLGDAVALNPNHRWTRIISGDEVRSRYPDADLSRVTTVVDPESTYVGIYANRVRLGASESGGSDVFVSAWSFRNAFGLPSPGFTLTPLRRSIESATGFAFIGDSVGESITEASYGQELPLILNGVFATDRYDAKSSRRTVGGSIEPDGIGAARLVPNGTGLVVVELGYNDEASALGDRIDEMMSELAARGVSQVAWLTMSERRLSGDQPRYALANEAVRDARGRWPQLIVLDWDAASDAPEQDRWYSDGVHLTTTGQAQFALWLRDEILSIADPSWVNAGELEHFVPVSPRRMLDTRSGLGASQAGRIENGTIELPLAGEGPLPGTGVEAVWVNVTAVDGKIDRYGGFVTAYPCGSIPDTSTLNFGHRQTVANSALVRLSDTGSICLYVFGSADLLVDVFGYLPAGSSFDALRPQRIIDTRSGLGVFEKGPIENDAISVRVTGFGDVPESDVSAVAVNITVDVAIADDYGGFVTAYGCGSVPDASSLNFVSGQTVANAAIVPVAEDGTICFSVNDETNLIVDVVGVMRGDAGFIAQTPNRVVDTRRTTRVGKLDGTGGPLEVQVASQTTIEGKRVVAASFNLTVVGTETNEYGGFATVYPCGTRPDVSNLNFTKSSTVAGGVVSPVDRNGRVCVYLYGAADVLVDVNGLITS